jgi:hypothetical protein
MIHRAHLLPLALLLACGATGDGTTGETTDDPGTTAQGTTAAPTTGPDATTTTSTTTTGETTDEPTAGDFADLCELQTNFSACSGAGCAGLYDTVDVAADCTQTMAGPLCLYADGVAGPPGPTRAYHRDVDGAPRYLLWNDDGRTPSGWTECTEAADAPPGCACLCDCPTTLCGQPGPDAC